jgi:hypothetical protein
MDTIIQIDKESLSPAVILKKSLSANGMTLYGKGFFVRWPNLREASHKLASLMTRMWPDGNAHGSPLLDSIMFDALTLAQGGMGNEPRVGERDAFIRSVINGLPRFFDVQLCCKTRSGWKRFEPLDDYLSDWIARHEPRTLNWLDEPHPASRHDVTKLLCAARIFSLRDIEASGVIDDTANGQGLSVTEYNNIV